MEEAEEAKVVVMEGVAEVEAAMVAAEMAEAATVAGAMVEAVTAVEGMVVGLVAVGRAAMAERVVGTQRKQKMTERTE